MLTAVEARTRQGDLLTLPLETPSGFIVADIDGLDPVKATLVSSSFANQDGEQYQSARREARNIKLKIDLDPDESLNETVRDLRRKLYRFFMPKSEVKLTFILTEGLDVEITGRVESFETDHFSQEPAVDISIMCFDPDFIDPIPVTIPGTTVSDETPRIITYDGTVETGITLVINVNRVLPDFTVYHTPPDDVTRTLEFDNYPLAAGDVLTISTVAGAKGATLVRAGTSSSVLYGISPQSNWIELVPGDNNLRVYAEGAAVPLSIEYTNKYGGL